MPGVDSEVDQEIGTEVDQGPPFDGDTGDTGGTPSVPTGPTYPSNFNDPSTTLSNVATFLVVKDTVVSTNTQGEYPTDSALGTGILSGITDSLGDLSTVMSSIVTAINSFQQYAAPNTGSLTPEQRSYAANLHGQKASEIRPRLLKCGYLIQRLTANFGVLPGVAVPSMYPSDQNNRF